MTIFPMALGLLFITLKLLEVIDWSWWLVLLPLYIPLPIALVLVIAAVIHVFAKSRFRRG
jgi:hypothetical protein